MKNFVAFVFIIIMVVLAYFGWKTYQKNKLESQKAESESEPQPMVNGNRPGQGAIDDEPPEPMVNGNRPGALNTPVNTSAQNNGRAGTSNLTPIAPMLYGNRPGALNPVVNTPVQPTGKPNTITKSLKPPSALILKYAPGKINATSNITSKVNL